MSAGVVGEIEKAQIGRFQGKSYRGAGVGARYLMDHGVMADMCIIGEPTGLHLQIGNTRPALGACQRRRQKATKFVLRGLQGWRKRFKIGKRNISASIRTKFMLPHGARSAPSKAVIRLSRELSPTTDIFVIVKMLPGTPPLAIKRELEQVCERVRKRSRIF